MVAITCHLRPFIGSLGVRFVSISFECFWMFLIALNVSIMDAQQANSAMWGAFWSGAQLARRFERFERHLNAAEVHRKGVPMINLLKSLDDAPIINFLSVAGCYYMRSAQNAFDYELRNSSGHLQIAHLSASIRMSVSSWLFMNHDWQSIDGISRLPS